MKPAVPASQTIETRQDERSDPSGEFIADLDRRQQLSRALFHRATLGARIQFFLRNGRAE